MTGICLHKTIVNFHLPVTEGSVIGLVISFSLEELKFKSFTNHHPRFPRSPREQSALEQGACLGLAAGDVLGDLRSNELIKVLSASATVTLLLLKHCRKFRISTGGAHQDDNQSHSLTHRCPGGVCLSTSVNCTSKSQHCSLTGGRVRPQPEPFPAEATETCTSGRLDMASDVAKIIAAATGKTPVRSFQKKTQTLPSPESLLWGLLCPRSTFWLEMGLWKYHGLQLEKELYMMQKQRGRCCCWEQRDKTNPALNGNDELCVKNPLHTRAGLCKI